MDRYLKSTNMLRYIHFGKNEEVHFRYIKRSIKRKRTEWKTASAEEVFDRVFG